MAGPGRADGADRPAPPAAGSEQPSDAEATDARVGRGAVAAGAAKPDVGGAGTADSPGPCRTGEQGVVGAQEGAEGGGMT